MENGTQNPAPPEFADHIETTCKRPLRFWFHEDPPHLDPQSGVGGLSWRIHSACYEGLVRLRSGGRIEKGSGLAEDWSISENGRVYTFYLKDDLRWSNGAPLLAEHFVYSFRRAADPRNDMRAAWQMYVLRGGRELHKFPREDYANITTAINNLGVHAEGPRELRIELEAPAAHFLQLLALPPFAPAHPDIPLPQNPSEVSQVVYNGPFIWTEFLPNKSIKLTPNPYYWDALTIKLSGIEIIIGGNPTQLYQEGKIDFLELEGPELSHFDPTHLHLIPEAITLYVAFNTEHPVLAKSTIRQAIAAAIDRSSLIKVAMAGSTQAFGLIPPVVQSGQFRATADEMLPPDSSAKVIEKPIDFDPADLPPLTLLTGNNDVNIREAQALADNLYHTLGLSLKVETTGYTERYQRARAGNYQLAMLAWKADYDDPISFLNEHVSNRDAGNQSRWSNQTYDDLIAKAHVTIDTKTRQQLLITAEQLLLKEAPLIPLCYRGRYWAIRPEVSGLLHVPVGPSPDIRWTAINDTSKNMGDI